MATERESPELVDSAVEAGERRLQRLTGGHVVTAFIGGLAVSFGVLAMAWTAGPWGVVLTYEQAHLVGALAFPIGFVILVVGKGELFTENFLLPVSGVMARRGSVGALLGLWGTTLAANLAGALLFAMLVTVPGVLADGARAFLIELGEQIVASSTTSLFLKGVFAGWLMTVLTWLLLAVRATGARLFVIWMIGFFLAAGHFNHVVVSAAELFMAMRLGADVTVAQWWWRSFLPAVTGNLIGGVVFVTMLAWLQAHSLRAR